MDDWSQDSTYLLDENTAEATERCVLNRTSATIRDFNTTDRRADTRGLAAARQELARAKGKDDRQAAQRPAVTGIAI